MQASYGLFRLYDAFLYYEAHHDKTAHIQRYTLLLSRHCYHPGLLVPRIGGVPMTEQEFKHFQEFESWLMLKPNPKKLEKHVTRLRAQMMTPFKLSWLPERKKIYWDERRDTR